MKFHFIVNPLAGQGNYKWTVRNIQRSLSRYDVEYEISIPSGYEESTLIANKASLDSDVVVAVGGDGTVNSVINGIIGSNAILGIVPNGTGNGFAREFGIPLSIRRACRTLIEGEQRWIDVGRTGNRYFLGTAGIGFDALIAKFTGQMLGFFRGMWIYFLAGLLFFHKYDPPLVRLYVDSESIQVYPLVVAVANTRLYGGRATIAPLARPDDGLFDICVARMMSSYRILLNLSKLFDGTHSRLPEVSIFKSDKVKIASVEPVPVHVDGEAIGNFSEIYFEIVPKAMKVLVPKTSKGA